MADRIDQLIQIMKDQHPELYAAYCREYNALLEERRNNYYPVGNGSRLDDWIGFMEVKTPYYDFNKLVNKYYNITKYEARYGRGRFPYITIRTNFVKDKSMVTLDYRDKDGSYVNNAKWASGNTKIVTKPNLAWSFLLQAPTIFKHMVIQLTEAEYRTLSWRFSTKKVGTKIIEYGYETYSKLFLWAKANKRRVVVQVFRDSTYQQLLWQKEVGDKLVDVIPHSLPKEGSYYDYLMSKHWVTLARVGISVKIKITSSHQLGSIVYQSKIYVLDNVTLLIGDREYNALANEEDLYAAVEAEEGNESNYIYVRSNGSEIPTKIYVGGLDYRYAREKRNLFLKELRRDESKYDPYVRGAAYVNKVNVFNDLVRKYFDIDVYNDYDQEYLFYCILRHKGDEYLIPYLKELREDSWDDWEAKVLGITHLKELVVKDIIVEELYGNEELLESVLQNDDDDDNYEYGSIDGFTGSSGIMNPDDMDDYLDATYFSPKAKAERRRKRIK